MVLSKLCWFKASPGHTNIEKVLLYTAYRYLYADHLHTDLFLFYAIYHMICIISWGEHGYYWELDTILSDRMYCSRLESEIDNQ